MSSLLPLSICIPSYNRGVRLRGLLEAIATQSIEGDDLFVSDDASPEDVSKVVASVLGFQYYRQPSNIGMVANWNYCLNNARCDWVCIVHDDDTMMAGGVAALRAACKFANEPAIILPSERQAECDATFRCRYWSPGAWAVLNCPTIPSGAIVHRKIIEDLGVFNPKFKYSPDLEYFPRIAAKYPTVIIDSPLAVKYELHSANYQLKTWRQPDFVSQLEEIQRLIVSYAQLDEAAAKQLVKQRLDSLVDYIRREAERRGDESLLKQYGWTSVKLTASPDRSFMVRLLALVRRKLGAVFLNEPGR